MFPRRLTAEHFFYLAPFFRVSVIAVVLHDRFRLLQSLLNASVFECACFFVSMSWKVLLLIFALSPIACWDFCSEGRRLPVTHGESQLGQRFCAWSHLTAATWQGKEFGDNVWASSLFACAAHVLALPFLQCASPVNLRGCPISFGFRFSARVSATPQESVPVWI